MFPSEKSESHARTVTATVNYVGVMEERPQHYAVDEANPRVVKDARSVSISNARSWNEAPDIDREGFALVHHHSKVRDFRNRSELVQVHSREIESLLLQISGADQTVVTPGGFRYSEKSGLAGNIPNTMPGRLVHVDFSDASARKRVAIAAPGGIGRVRRFALYNIWRVVSSPPQDAPLAVCDARSVDPGDLRPLDFVYDSSDDPKWSFEGLIARYNAAHRWVYWSNMRIDEALIFKANDSDPGSPHCVPHTAFDDPTCPPDAPPRVSIEMRGVALWFQ